MSRSRRHQPRLPAVAGLYLQGILASLQQEVAWKNSKHTFTSSTVQHIRWMKHKKP